jgi:hypothetical protein
MMTLLFILATMIITFSTADYRLTKDPHRILGTISGTTVAPASSYVSKVDFYKTASHDGFGSIQVFYD